MPVFEIVARKLEPFRRFGIHRTGADIHFTFTSLILA
jgi:hypothetical protein